MAENHEALVLRWYLSTEHQLIPGCNLPGKYQKVSIDMRYVKSGMGMMNDSVSQSLFDLSCFSKKQAKDAWIEHMGVWCDTKIRSTPEYLPSMSMQAWHTGEVIPYFLRNAVPQDFCRTRSHISRSSDACYILHFYPDATWYFPGLETQAKSNDLVLADMAIPHVTQTRPIGRKQSYHDFGVFIPHRLLDPLLNSQLLITPHVLRADLPLVTMLRKHVYTFINQLPNMTLAESRGALKAMIDLLACALNGEISEPHLETVKNAVLKNVRDYIQRHLSDSSLAADTLAAKFRMSIRKLYKLFEPYGGVQHYIRKQRLQKVYAEITDPYQYHMNITDIAQRYGFLQRKNFNAAFLRQFNLTPREARAYAKSGQSQNLDVIENQSDFWNWLMQLR